MENTILTAQQICNELGAPREKSVSSDQIALPEQGTSVVNPLVISNLSETNLRLPSFNIGLVDNPLAFGS
jgi:hypothetical protein